MRGEYCRYKNNNDLTWMTAPVLGSAGEYMTQLARDVPNAAQQAAQNRAMFQVGDRVLVHGDWYRESPQRSPKFRTGTPWESRILCWDGSSGAWGIALRDRTEGGIYNVYPASVLTRVTDGDDWTAHSQFRRGMQVIVVPDRRSLDHQLPRQRRTFNLQSDVPATIVAPGRDKGTWLIEYASTSWRDSIKDELYSSLDFMVANESELTAAGAVQLPKLEDNGMTNSLVALGDKVSMDIHQVLAAKDVPYLSIMRVWRTPFTSDCHRVGSEFVCTQEYGDDSVYITVWCTNPYKAQIIAALAAADAYPSYNGVTVKVSSSE
jgi:hypothetical protein